MYGSYFCETSNHQMSIRLREPSCLLVSNYPPSPLQKQSRTERIALASTRNCLGLKPRTQDINEHTTIIMIIHINIQVCDSTCSHDLLTPRLDKNLQSGILYKTMKFSVAPHGDVRVLPSPHPPESFGQTVHRIENGFGGDINHKQGDNYMNKDQALGKFSQIEGKAKRIWAELTDDDVKRAEGSADKLYGIIQERFGDQKEDVKRKIDDLKMPF